MSIITGAHGPFFSLSLIPFALTPVTMSAMSEAYTFSITSSADPGETLPSANSMKQRLVTGRRNTVQSQLMQRIVPGTRQVKM
jgi:hypothetical protein